VNGTNEQFLASPRSVDPDAEDAGPPFVVGDIVRHKRTGGRYEITAWARLESSLEEVIVYRSLTTPESWVRPRSEMFDGRFERIR
jgi:hypothetical protein